MSKYIKGKFKRSIFTSERGYIIGLFKVSDVSDESLADCLGKSVTFTGYFHELNETDTYLFYGDRINHVKYGEQFQVESYERVKPEDKDNIVEFLTSDIFKGIGEKKAMRIVDSLGKDTLNVILENPDNLVLIPTITKANADLLHSKLKEYESSYEVIIYLGDIGFSTKDSMAIYNKYKNMVNTIIENNIYDLIDNSMYLGFKKIDKIAVDMGIEKDSLIRISASIIYIIEELSNMYGHSYFYKDELVKILPRIIGEFVETDLIEEALNKLIFDNKIIVKDDRYYLSDMYEAETLIVKRFRLLNSSEVKTVKNLDRELAKIQLFHGIEYNEDQRNAIVNCFENNFSIITGGPGTGKTTILRAIVELYRQINKYSDSQMLENLVLLSPTGRASKRMSEVTNMPAFTIHRFLKWQKDSNKFLVNEYNKSKAKLIILDEVSMIDTYLMANLLKGISSNCRIVLVGDSEQLPSVGPGDLLKDLIDSESLVVSSLSKLYRQSENSNILNLAYDIRKDDLSYDVFNLEDDLTFIECSDDEVISHIENISSIYKDYSYKNIQILAPMYKTINGIDNINNHIQSIFNPKKKSLKEIVIGEVLFRENDKVIQLTNMPDDNVYNGDIGIIKRIVSSPKKEVYIEFDSGVVKYTPANFNNFRLAYSISIHKAQGSEFDVVIIPIVKGYKKMLYKKLIYTAITRSKKKLYIIGDYDALKLSVLNKDSDVRRTSIKDFLISGIK